MEVYVPQFFTLFCMPGKLKQSLNLFHPPAWRRVSCYQAWYSSFSFISLDSFLNHFRNKDIIHVCPNPKICCNYVGNFMPIKQMWSERKHSACLRWEDHVSVHTQPVFEWKTQPCFAMMYNGRAVWTCLESLVGYDFKNNPSTQNFNGLFGEF